MKRLGLLVAVALLTSCGLRVGPINNPPAPKGPERPSQVTVSRVPSIMGWPVPMIFTIDGEEIYGLWGGQSHSFLLEPGYYRFGYFLGFNECRHGVHIDNRPSQHFLLGPPCRIRRAEQSVTPWSVEPTERAEPAQPNPFLESY